MKNVALRGYIFEFYLNNDEETTKVATVARNQTEAKDRVRNLFNRDDDIFWGMVTVYNLRPAVVKYNDNGKNVSYLTKAILDQGQLIHLTENGQAYIRRCKIDLEKSDMKKNFTVLVKDEPREIVFQDVER